MTDGFDFSALRRWPDVEAPNLQAWDATDELLVRHALGAGVPGDEIAVVGDEYGAITLALSDAGLRGIRVHQDLVTGRRALARNAAALGFDVRRNPDDPVGPRRVGARHAEDDADGPGFDAVLHELDAELLSDARLVLLRLPKSLAELEEFADAIARWAASDVTVVAGGRVKHMTPAQNDVLARFFDAVQPQRAERKSRVVVADGLRRPSGPPPFPVRERHVLGSGEEIVLCAHGGAFAGARLDIGTRVLLDVLPDLTGSQPWERRQDRSGGDRAAAADAASSVQGDGPVVVDLGCGTGALAAVCALRHPDARVVATDRSAAAVRSAAATMTANGLRGRVAVSLDDAGSELPGAAVDLVLLNPPFHLGVSVHSGAGHRLIEAAARLLRPDGEVWTVFNSHLDHRRVLQRLVGPTEQVVRTPKFTVTRTVRR